jgi:hypothetical protein
VKWKKIVRFISWILWENMMSYWISMATDPQPSCIQRAPYNHKFITIHFVTPIQISSPEFFLYLSRQSVGRLSPNGRTVRLFLSRGRISRRKFSSPTKFGINQILHERDSTLKWIETWCLFSASILNRLFPDHEISLWNWLDSICYHRFYYSESAY